MNREQRRQIAKRHGKSRHERKQIEQAIKQRDAAEAKAAVEALPDGLAAVGFEVVKPGLIVPGRGQE